MDTEDIFNIEFTGNKSLTLQELLLSLFKSMY